MSLTGEDYIKHIQLRAGEKKKIFLPSPDDFEISIAILSHLGGSESLALNCADYFVDNRQNPSFTIRDFALELETIKHDIYEIEKYEDEKNKLLANTKQFMERFNTKI